MRRWLWVGLASLFLACGVEQPAEEAQTGGTEGGAGRAGPVAVWLDVDPAIGIDGGEVDDGLALIQAFFSPEIVVRGVSVVFGNTSLERAVPIAREVVTRFGPGDLGVYPGAASASELGVETEAVRAMAAALERERLVILALGPVTNVGSLLRLHPEAAERIERVVVVAGRRVGQSFRTGDRDVPPHRDFNFELDPEAMRIVLDSGVRLEMAPWEVSSQVWIRQADLDEMAGRSERGRWIRERTASWVALWRDTFGVDGFNPFDTLAVGWVTQPGLIEAIEVGVWIEEREDDRAPGSGTQKPYLFVDPNREEAPRAVYAVRPLAGFHSVLIDRLAGIAQ